MVGSLRITLLVLLAACSASGNDGSDADGRIGPIVDGGIPDVPRADAPVYCPTMTPPAFETCTIGPFYADCGGNGPPRLACRDMTCTWFTTSCVAEGFIASDCPANGICCVNGFPFETSAATQSRDFTLNVALWGYGNKPWNATRDMAVDVVIDPGLQHSSASGFTCTPTTGGPATVCDPRNESADIREPMLTSLATFRLGDQIFPAGANLRVDVDPSRPKARVCQHFYTDAFNFKCHNMTVLCAISGTLTLPKLPATREELDTMPYRLDVQFGSTRIQGEQ